MYLKIWTAWALVALLIAWDLHGAFCRYEKDKQAWKLCLHTLLLAILGYLMVYLGLFCLRMQFDLGPWARPSKMFRSVPRATQAIGPAGHAVTRPHKKK